MRLFQRSCLISAFLRSCLGDGGQQLLRGRSGNTVGEDVFDFSDEKAMIADEALANANNAASEPSESRVEEARQTLQNYVTQSSGEPVRVLGEDGEGNEMFWQEGGKIYDVHLDGGSTVRGGGGKGVNFIFLFVIPSPPHFVRMSSQCFGQDF